MGPRLGRPCDAGRGLPKAARSGRAPNALRTRLPSCQMRWGQVHVAGVGREQATRHMQSALPERSMAAPQADSPQGRTAATLCFLRLFSRYGHRNTVTVGCQMAQSLGWERVGPAPGPAPSGGVLSSHAAAVGLPSELALPSPGLSGGASVHLPQPRSAAPPTGRGLASRLWSLRAGRGHPHPPLGPTSLSWTCAQRPEFCSCHLTERGTPDTPARASGCTGRGRGSEASPLGLHGLPPASGLAG